MLLTMWVNRKKLEKTRLYFVINLYVDKLVDNVNKYKKPLRTRVSPVSNYVDSVDMSEN